MKASHRDMAEIVQSLVSLKDGAFRKLDELVINAGHGNKDVVIHETVFLKNVICQTIEDITLKLDGTIKDQSALYIAHTMACKELCIAKEDLSNFTEDIVEEDTSCKKLTIT